MSIKPSAAAEIRALIAALASDDEIKRESAIARLAIIGPRAMDRLIAAYAAADRQTRVAILRTAEAVTDPRAIPIALDALAGGGELALAAVPALRSLLNSPNEQAATGALDALIETALNRSAERRVRMAAFDALQDTPATVRERVAEALRADADPGLKTLADPADPARGVWQDAVEGQLPEDPAPLREAVDTRAPTAPLGALQKLIDALRIREAAPASPVRREGWREARAALHQALALRGSRVALYDLRETLARATEPLPPAFLAAAHVVGDDSCLEPLAAAWTAAGDPRWRHQLEAAFQAIVKRDKIPRRGAVMKRIAARFPEAAEGFSTTWRTTPRRKIRGRT